MNPKDTPIVIYSEAQLGKYYSKAAMSVLRYGEWDILAIIDSTKAGQSIEDVTGIKHSAPIVSSLEEALKLKPEAMLIGIAFAGGALPEPMADIVKESIKNKLDIISGFHHYLADNLELKELANEHNIKLWDVRNPELYTASNSNTVAKQKLRPDGVKVITMVGSDCSTGKMSSALEINQELHTRNIKSEFIATGQNGIMINGTGIPLDGIAGDFMAGSIENLIFETIEEKNPELIILEGQGSLIHPGFSGVTLSLLHGSNPDYMILCHKPDRITANGDYQVKIPSLTRLIEIYEEAAGWTLVEGKKAAKVIGICLNTSAYSEEEAKEIISKAKEETKLPVIDTVRFGGGELIDRLMSL